MGSVLSFTSPGVVEVVNVADPPLGADEVRIQTLFSGISAGTELTSYRGSNPHLTKSWDPSLRLFAAGTSDVKYPDSGFGYEEVGDVVELGSAVTTVAVNDRIWGTWGHRTSAVVSADFAAKRKLDPSVDPRLGMFSHIGAIALNAVIDADIHIGETVALFGLGVPGQLVAQLARLNGGRVIAGDGIASRRELARELGADLVLDPADGDVAKRIRELTDGRGADVAIEITGNYAALQEAMRTVAYNSRVCVAGFFQGGGTALNLGEEFHHNRVQVVSSQISGLGPSVAHRWDRQRLASTAISLAVDGRLRVLPLISHTVPLTGAADAYRMLDEHPGEALQVVIDMGQQ